MTFTAREYQDKVIRHIVQKPRCAVWAGMGMGKTSSTLFALDYLWKAGEDVYPALVLAPLRVAATTWPDEGQKWSELGMRIESVTGTEKERTAALYKPAHVFTINYENIPWLVQKLGDHWPFKTVVADESTRLKSFRLGGGGSIRAKKLSTVAFKSDRFIELTGTPAPNGLEDLWGQFWFLDKGYRLGRIMTVFHNRWFQQRQVAADPHAIKWDAKANAQAEIQSYAADLTISLKPEDWFPLTEPTEIQIPVDLPVKAQKVYQQLCRETVAKIKGTEINAVNAAALSMKCLQCASGAVYDDDGVWHELHKEKLKALESIIEEAAGAPVLVAYHWQSDLDRLQKAFPQGVPLDRDPQTIKDWNAGRIPLLFAHPQSAGHGLNLQDGGNILVFFSHWWNLEHYQQICERIGPTRQMQAGHPRPVFIYNIVAANTLDEAVVKRRKTKASVQETLLQAMKEAA